jgi:hypothetical protein
MSVLALVYYKPRAKPLTQGIFAGNSCFHKELRLICPIALFASASVYLINTTALANVYLLYLVNLQTLDTRYSDKECNLGIHLHQVVFESRNYPSLNIKVKQYLTSFIYV